MPVYDTHVWGYHFFAPSWAGGGCLVMDSGVLVLARYRVRKASTGVMRRALRAGYTPESNPIKILMP